MYTTDEVLGKIVDNIEKVIIGKRDSIELLLLALVCNGHVLIEDVPGVGKTSLVSAMAKSINASFKRIQFTPDILPSDITGFSVFNQKTGDFEFRPGAIMSQIILADEINRTSPKTQASLLEVMEEGQVTVDGATYKVPKPFMVMATQNPVEYLGTFPLPEAQLDRFFMKVSLGYPSANEESMILSRFCTSNPLETLTPVADSQDIISLQENVKNVHVDKSLKDYIVDIVSQTRRQPDVLLGASPRGSLSLFRASQAWAFYNKRSYVIPDDIKKMVFPVLSHRIILKQEAKLKKISTRDILASIVDSIKVPVVD
ncbi:magnesium chelatase [Clostridium thermosuccinogenes]|jgi:MoxR-like ATPase|uniref:Magnesium chelatase n=1 Tax=Clostridium thermosuccinogenes TaxID=84032 RepID=A0A2K2F2A2_9CLOT|nr:MoxR family ATPase [Pseudoclostridium thermosuccinogenes]AUS96442.1 magnesium chelatase [Pseudoclostridium thermosuccinogenes]PNT92892.1 magnesium chelatase [Pseudoclostridium thermosuccinogenes]PNT97786.1 magnesium chelatase [Pseudoclostridium thermosuccinogenes]PNT99776.1 magnesium chelatase [Pseudoclostridium thermosuccinogenes]